MHKIRTFFLGTVLGTLVLAILANKISEKVANPVDLAMKWIAHWNSQRRLKPKNPPNPSPKPVSPVPVRHPDALAALNTAGEATPTSVAPAPAPPTTPPLAPSTKPLRSPVPAEIERFALLVLEDPDNQVYVNRHINEFLPKGFLSKRRKKNRDVAFNSFYFDKVRVTAYIPPFISVRCFNTRSSPSPVVRDVVIKIAWEDDHFVVIPPEPENIDWDNENVSIPLYWRITEARELTLDERRAVEAQRKE